jgi:hypothetical protein
VIAGLQLGKRETKRIYFIYQVELDLCDTVFHFQGISCLYLSLTKAFHLISTLVEYNSTAVKSILSLSPVYSSACQLLLSAETFVFLDHHVHVAAVAISKEST